MSGRGLCVSLEGGDGVGKTAQGRRVRAALEARGVRAILHHEPSEPLRALLLRSDIGWPPGAEACLFLASQARALREVIVPALAEGAVVLCDRFADSAMAYQGGGRGLDLEALRAAKTLALGDFDPDLTFFLNAPPEDALARATENDAFHADIAFQHRVRAAYVAMAQDNPRFITLDALGSMEAITQEILATILARLA